MLDILKLGLGSFFKEQSLRQQKTGTQRALVNGVSLGWCSQTDFGFIYYLNKKFFFSGGQRKNIMAHDPTLPHLSFKDCDIYITLLEVTGFLAGETILEPTKPLDSPAISHHLPIPI